MLENEKCSTCNREKLTNEFDETRTANGMPLGFFSEEVQVMFHLRVTRVISPQVSATTNHGAVLQFLTARLVVAETFTGNRTSNSQVEHEL